MSSSHLHVKFKLAIQVAQLLGTYVDVGSVDVVALVVAVAVGLEHHSVVVV